MSVIKITSKKFRAIFFKIISFEISLDRFNNENTKIKITARYKQTDLSTVVKQVFRQWLRERQRTTKKLIPSSNCENLMESTKGINRK